MSLLHLQTKMLTLDGAGLLTLKVSQDACPRGNENIPLTLFRHFLICMGWKVREKRVYGGECQRPCTPRHIHSLLTLDDYNPLRQGKTWLLKKVLDFQLK